ncbi:MAG TPA: SusD/RagB family nutrient-binding outer membrane lipoprotein [Saprospiraceae bacterium]|nr:SusD/RagB family nutrient-binding outer membrane lipoprotein [Lewinellaceae bacterium]HRV84686.1 SusD/RagB family nutrient-binding outer membrane lipoprotein [Saprospiraceae bacterium]
MKKLRYTGAILAILLAGACSDFGDINIDPNNPSTPSTAALLTGALRSIPGHITAETPELYVQHISQKYYTDGSRYATVNFSYNGYYSGPLIGLQEIIKLLEDPATSPAQLKNGRAEDQLAVAKILQSYYYWQMTDAWGPIPYSQALAGRENFRPAFDDQDAVYDGIFTTLSDAASQLDVSRTISGDIMLDGDLAKWKKFANSIRLIAALRLSEVAPDKAKAEFVAAMNGGVLESNDDNILYTHLSDENNDNPWEDRFQTRLDQCVSKPLVDLMNATNDPRLPIYADPAKASGLYVGMPYGLTQDEAGDIPNNDVSFVGSTVRQKTTPTYVLTYSQILFSFAEAAHRGWISGGEAAAEQFYLDAIKANLEQWGAYSDDDYTAFIAQDEVKYDVNIAMERIMTQKWVSLYLNGYEAWSEWRRTGLPALSPPALVIHPTKAIPVRYGYPTSERDLNGENYDAVVAKLGKDDIDVPVWWDK